MRLVSFDVFDTVLTRTLAEPHDLFLRVGEALQAADPAMPAAPAFAAARHEAERAARDRAPRREVVLDDIYAVLAGRLSWEPAQRTTAQAAEIAIETENIRPVPGMQAEITAARRTAGRIVFISDMYLPSAVIRGWLERAGLWQAGDLLYVSGEAGACKGTGELFDKIRADLAADFGTWLHHGDHPVSDVAQPGRLGLATRHLTAARLTRREKKLRGPGPFAPGWLSALAGAGRLARLDQPGPDPDPRRRALWAAGAGVAGPLFYGFTEWCLAEAARRGLTDLYFLARGGQIFFRLAREIEAVRPRHLRLHYLPVSRLALSGTADLTRPERWRDLATSRLVFHSARQACANLGLTPEAQPRPAWLAATDWDRNLTPAEREKFADWLLDPVRWPAIQVALRQRRDNARRYLQAQGLPGNGRAGLVDTGWRGTIQYHLELALGDNEVAAPVTGFYLGVNRQPEFRCGGPQLAYSSALTRHPPQRDHTARILVELMARADHGPVLGYASDAAGRLSPQYGPPGPADIEEIRFFQSAVLAFTRRALDAGSQLASAPPAALAGTVIDNHAGFYLRPNLTEAEVFGRMTFSDQLYEQHHAVLCPAMNVGEILTAMINWRRRPPGWWLAGQAQFGHRYLLYPYMALKIAKWQLESVLTNRSEPT